MDFLLSQCSLSLVWDPNNRAPRAHASPRAHGSPRANRSPRAFFARQKHLVVAAQGATHLPREGARGACMNSHDSHAVGPRSIWAAGLTRGSSTSCPLRGAQGCHPPDSVARNPAQLTARLRKWLHHSPRTSVPTTLPRECTLRVTPCEGASQGWYGGPAPPRAGKPKRRCLRRRRPSTLGGYP